MKRKSSHHRIILMGFVPFLLLLALAYFFRYEFNISIQLPQESDLTKSLSGTMQCTLISNIQDSHYLRMKLAVPYRDRKQWVEIRNALPKIKNQFIMAISQEGVEEIVQERDFESMRSLLLQIFNKNLERPLDNIYFENFFYD